MERRKKMAAAERKKKRHLWVRDGTVWLENEQNDPTIAEDIEENNEQHCG